MFKKVPGAISDGRRGDPQKVITGRSPGLKTESEWLPPVATNPRLQFSANTATYLDRPVSQFFPISSFPSSSWVRGWHVELWTSMGKFYTIRYSGRGYETGGVWPGAHKMCAPEAPCFEAWEGGLEADFGPKLIFIKIRFFQGLGGL